MFSLPYGFDTVLYCGVHNIIVQQHSPGEDNLWYILPYNPYVIDKVSKFIDDDERIKNVIASIKSDMMYSNDVFLELINRNKKNHPKPSIVFPYGVVANDVIHSILMTYYSDTVYIFYDKNGLEYCFITEMDDFLYSLYVIKSPKEFNKLKFLKEDGVSISNRRYDVYKLEHTLEYKNQFSLIDYYILSDIKNRNIIKIPKNKILLSGSYETASMIFGYGYCKFTFFNEVMRVGIHIDKIRIQTSQNLSIIFLSSNIDWMTKKGEYVDNFLNTINKSLSTGWCELINLYNNSGNIGMIPTNTHKYALLLGDVSKEDEVMLKLKLS